MITEKHTMEPVTREHAGSSATIETTGRYVGEETLRLTLETREEASIHRAYEAFLRGDSADFSATFCLLDPDNNHQLGHEKFKGYSKLTEELLREPRPDSDGLITDCLVTDPDGTVVLMMTEAALLDGQKKLVHTITYSSVLVPDQITD